MAKALTEKGARALITDYETRINCAESHLRRLNESKREFLEKNRAAWLKEGAVCRICDLHPTFGHETGICEWGFCVGLRGKI